MFVKYVSRKLYEIGISFKIKVKRSIFLLITCIFEHGSNKRNINFAVLSLYLCKNLLNMDIVGPGFEGVTNFNGPPPPSPELLQQKIPYSRVPDSRQLEANSNLDSSQTQTSQAIIPMTQKAQMPPPQKTEMTNVLPSKCFQVKLI